VRVGCGSILHDVTDLACVAVRYSGLESWEQHCGTGDDILDLVTERGDVRLYHEALLVDLASQENGGELSARFRTPLGTLDLVFGGVRDRVLWPAPEMAAPPGGSGSGIDPALLEFVSFLAQKSAADCGRRDLILGTTLFSVCFSADVLRVDWVDDVDGVGTDHRALGLAELEPLSGTEDAAPRGPRGTGAQRRLTHEELVDLAAGAVMDQARLATSGTLTLSLRTGDGAHTVSFLGVDEMTVSGGAEVCGVGEVWVPLDGPGPRRLVVQRCSRETEVSRAGGSIRVVLDDEADGVAVSFRFREVWSGKRAVRETGDLSPSR